MEIPAACGNYYFAFFLSKIPNKFCFLFFGLGPVSPALWTVVCLAECGQVWTTLSLEITSASNFGLTSSTTPPGRGFPYRSTCSGIIQTFGWLNRLSKICVEGNFRRLSEISCKQRKYVILVAQQIIKNYLDCILIL